MGGIRRSFTRALAAGAIAAVAVTAQNAAATDIDVLRSEAQSVGDEITSMGQRLDQLQERQAALSDEIAATDAEVSALEYETSATEDAYDRALERLEARAVETYKGGTSAELSLLLSAETLTQIETVAHALEKAAELDEAALDDLVAAKTEAEETQSALADRKEQLLEARAERDALVEDIETTIAERDQILAELNDEIDQLEREARREARREAEAAVLTEAPELGKKPGTPQNPTWGTHAPDRLVGTGPADGIPAAFTTTGVSFEGEASWYGPGFEGNTTANGDIFDSRLYTVASKTLPFGTYLYVTYGGRGVIVYVNDRGPYAGDRILDLSHAAAQAIGITGVGWVRAEIIVKK